MVSSGNQFKHSPTLFLRWNAITISRIRYYILYYEQLCVCGLLWYFLVVSAIFNRLLYDFQLHRIQTSIV